MRSSHIVRNSLALAVATVLSFNVNAQEVNAQEVSSFQQWFEQGKFLLNMRYRIEQVDDDALREQAVANTLRTRLGFQTGNWNGWYFLAEAENISDIGSERFNSTANGRSAYPVVADPSGSEWNQAFVGYSPTANMDFRLGRQAIDWGNQRFIGSVAWRQNQQTFDAAALRWSNDSGVAVNAAYLDKVHRVFGNYNPNPLQAEQDLNAYVVDVGSKLGNSTLAGYMHLIENQDKPFESHRNLGIRYNGAHKFNDANQITWILDYAKQDDYANGASKIDANYLLAEAVYSHKTLKITGGYELLSGDGQYAFQTPLATLHKFNGWADKFLTTPVNGLQDTYLGVSGTLLGMGWQVVAHDFNSDKGGSNYGEEWNLQLSKTFNPRLSGLIKFADYNADTFASDSKKLWLQLDFKY